MDQCFIAGGAHTDSANRLGVFSKTRRGVFAKTRHDCRVIIREEDILKDEEEKNKETNWRNF